MRSRARRFFPALAVLLVSCADSTATSGDWAIEIGLLLPELSRAAVISVPEPIIAGRPSTVIINTFGSSSCVRPAGVVVAGARSSLQTLTPLDSVAVRARACTDDLAQHPHAVVLTFPQAGEAAIRVRGNVRGSDLVLRLETIEASVTVRP